MGHNHRPVDGKHKNFDSSMTNNNKKASSNYNRFVVGPTWISYAYYSEDETFSGKKNEDHQLKNEDIETWQRIIAEMKELSTISVPWYIGGEKAQLLCFCDASEKAYAIAIYLKTSYEGNVDVNLRFWNQELHRSRRCQHRDSNC